MKPIASSAKTAAILLVACIVGYGAGIGLGLLNPCGRLGLLVQTIAIVPGIAALLLFARTALQRRSWRIGISCIALGILLFFMFGATGMTCAVA